MIPAPHGYLTLDQWGGTYAGRARMALPARFLIPHHSVTNEDIGVNPTASAAADFRELDAIGRSRGHRGISYSWEIHPQGVIGEGQGLYLGAHTYGHNSDGFGVCFIGNYEVDGLTDEAVESFRWLRDWMLERRYLVGGVVHPEGDHSTYYSTACAGRNVRARMADLRQPFSVPPSPEEDDEMYAYAPTLDGGLLVFGVGYGFNNTRPLYHRKLDRNGTLVKAWSVFPNSHCTSEPWASAHGDVVTVGVRGGGDKTYSWSSNDGGQTFAVGQSWAGRVGSV